MASGAKQSLKTALINWWMVAVVAALVGLTALVLWVEQH